MKRILAIDSLRGIAILVMVFFHSSYYWQREISVEQLDQMLSHPLAIAAFFLGKFAGIFAVISGMANTVSIYRRVENNHEKPRRIFWGSFIAGLWIIIVGKFHSSFLNHTSVGNPLDPYPTGPKNFTMITGSIQSGSLQIPSIYIILYKNTALFVIGIGIITTGLVLSIILFRNGIEHTNRNYFIVGLLASAIVLIIEPMKLWLRPIWTSQLANEQYIGALFTGVLIGDSYPVFPFAGYALYGVLFGMAFHYKVSTDRVNKLALPVGFSYLILGMYYFTQFGQPSIITTFQTPSPQLNFSQIGVLILICTLMYNFEYMQQQNILKQILFSEFIRKFGLLSLTVFIMEALLGNLVKKFILDLLVPGWAISIFPVSLFSVVLILTWSVLISYWGSYNYIWSWEWINAKMIGIISGRKTTRIHIKQHLHVTKPPIEIS